MQHLAEAPAAATNTAHTDYDAIIVSTSPVCLMTAVALRTQGKRVLLVDQSPVVGGAWITTDLAGFENVEVGCHLIDPDPAVYRFMQALGIPMQPLSPRPEVISRDARRPLPKRIPYSHRWLRDLYDIVARPEPSPFVESHPSTASLKDQLKNAYRVMRHAFHAIRGDTAKILYPPGGCNVITARLAELVALSGVEVRTSTSVSDVVIDDATGTVRLMLNGEPATCGRAYITASVSLPHVAHGEELVPLERKQHVFQNLYLVVRDAGKIDLSYTLIYGDHVVHRISDLTRFARRTPDLEDAVILGLTVDENREETPEFAAECLERLKEYRVIAPGTQMVDYCFLPYKFTWLDPARRRWLRSELAPSVHVIDSESMTRSIKNLLRDEDVAPLLAFAAANPYQAAASAGSEAA